MIKQTSCWLGEGLLTRAEACEAVGRLGVRLSPSTLARMFSQRSNGPPCVHFGRRVYYPRRLLFEWLYANLTDLRTSSKQRRRTGIWTLSRHDSVLGAPGASITRARRAQLQKLN